MHTHDLFSLYRDAFTKHPEFRPGRFEFFWIPPFDRHIAITQNENGLHYFFLARNCRFIEHSGSIKPSGAPLLEMLASHRIPPPNAIIADGASAFILSDGNPVAYHEIHYELDPHARQIADQLLSLIPDVPPGAPMTIETPAMQQLDPQKLAEMTLEIERSGIPLGPGSGFDVDKIMAYLRGLPRQRAEQILELLKNHPDFDMVFMSEEI